MKNQFETLRPWLRRILEEIKREIKTEHLGLDPLFYRAHFGVRPQNRLTAEEIFGAYERELLAGNQELAEWVVNRWVFKHRDLYSHFAERLGAIHPHFDQIQTLTEEQSWVVLAGAADSFGAVETFLFSVLNGVVFPETVLAKLREEAVEEESSIKAEAENGAERESLAQILERHQREISRLREKYEGKIAGVQRKYTVDVEALKKQIRALQQKLGAL